MEAQKFNDGYGFRDKAIIYGLCGGIPQYHEIFAKKRRQTVSALLLKNVFKHMAHSYLKANLLYSMNLRIQLMPFQFLSN